MLVSQDESTYKPTVHHRLSQLPQACSTGSRQVLDLINKRRYSVSHAFYSGRRLQERLKSSLNTRMVIESPWAPSDALFMAQLCVGIISWSSRGQLLLQWGRRVVKLLTVWRCDPHYVPHASNTCTCSAPSNREALTVVGLLGRRRASAILRARSSCPSYVSRR